MRHWEVFDISTLAPLSLVRARAGLKPRASAFSIIKHSLTKGVCPGIYTSSSLLFLAVFMFWWMPSGFLLSKNK